MSTFFAFFDRLFIWIPRVVLVRSTHGGVKWRSKFWKTAGPDVVELKPGLHWYWSLTSDVELIVTARRPVDVPVMSLLTKDGKSIIVAAAVVFRINDVIKALAEKNWDVDSTLVDHTQSAIFQAVRTRTFNELCEGSELLINELTEHAKTELRKFGILVERVLLKDFDRSKTFRMLGETVSFLEQESEE